MSILWLMLVGLIAGWLAGVLVRGGGYGLVGAVIGGWLFGGMWPAGGLLGAILLATLGAVVLLVVLRLVQRA